MVSIELTELAERITHAAAAAPPASGEGSPITSTSDHLEEGDWMMVWEAIHAVREHDVKTFVRFSERFGSPT